MQWSGTRVEGCNCVKCMRGGSGEGRKEWKLKWMTAYDNNSNKISRYWRKTN